LTPDTALLWESRGAAPLVTAGKTLATAKLAIAANAPRRHEHSRRTSFRAA